ncbi:MAG: hypothetical protein H6718_20010 [Polyangiaceae bacterium]|nr:hypothetical protein [Polyangiaceae bacterium]MCB9605504.1 hypothetical protein [Polyangiaceae bacterium]
MTKEPVRNAALWLGTAGLCVACGGQATSPELSPEELIPKSTPVTLSAGADHTCALRGDGRVACWGRADHGELGNGFHGSQLEPVPVRNFNVAVHSISSGGLHTCVLSMDGSVWCWGQSDQGQAGSLQEIQFPEEVTALHRRVEQLSAGGYHSCALIRDGSVECWGRGGRGALGHGFDDSEVPLKVAGLPKAQQVVAGRNNSCALTFEGEVYCWGAETTGILGAQTEHSVATPVRIQFPSAVTRLASATADQACALLDDGRLFCWGSSGDERIDFPMEKSLEQPLSDIHLGGNQSCGITSSQELGCWESGYVEPYAEAPALSGVEQVSAGQGHVCARTADEVWCWGSTQYGQTGGYINTGTAKQVFLE